MKTIKIGVTILLSITLAGWLFAGMVMASPSTEQSPSKVDYVQDEVIVKFKNDSKPFRVVKVAKGTVLDEVKKYKKRDDVVYAEPNYIWSVDLMPDDPDFSKLWGLHNTGQTGGTPDADIDAPEAWDIQTGSSDVVIAVIDTGVDYNHEDLIVNMWTNSGEIPDNGIDDDANGFIDDVRGWDFSNDDNDPFDDHGHGTHCAGTIGAVGDNNIGITGVNWRVKIMPIKFLNSTGYGTTEDAVDAVNYATQMGVHVMSNSWGGGGPSEALKDAIQAADDAGILFVAAAGNNNFNNDSWPHYPSNYEVSNVVAVAATDHNDEKASFSSYGAESVDLGAPGVNIYSTVPTGACARCDASGYRYLSGTSMATPHVAGVAGLIKAQFPALLSDGLKARLLGGVDPISSLDGITLTGGRLNAYNAFEEDNIPPSEVTDLAAGNPTLLSIILTWTATGDDGDVDPAFSYDIRYSASPIDETNWDGTSRLGGEPRPQAPGSSETFTVTDLDYNTTYYFAIKVIDDVGNQSGLSNIASETTASPIIIFEDDMESGENGWTAESLWHLETYRFHSPVTSWAYNTGAPDYNYSVGITWGGLLSPFFDLTTGYGSAFLKFKYWYETDNEISPRRLVRILIDGVVIGNVTLYGDSMRVWNEYMLDLSFYIGHSNVQVQFWFDDAIAMFDNEGWYIDDVVVFGSPAEPNNAPVADADGPYAGTEGVPVIFDGSGSYDLDGDPLTYIWAFGDGSRGIGVSPVHTYMTHGAYPVTLEVYDGKVYSLPSRTIVEIIDLVNISKAEYNNGSRTLLVEATSSIGGEALLEVVDFGAMEYDKRKDKYSFKAAGVDNPGTVTVISLLGGTDTENVTEKGGGKNK